MQKKPLLVLAIILLALIVLYVSISAKKTTGIVPVITPVPAVTSPVSTSSLSFSQLLNASVSPEWDEDNGMIALKDGEYDSGENSVDLLKTPESYVSTDLNSDGAGDIIAVVASNSGGTGYFYELVAFLNVEGSPRYVGKFFLGDRIKVNKISADKNVVTADIITQGPGEPLCCGTTRVVKRYVFGLEEGFKEL